MDGTGTDTMAEPGVAVAASGEAPEVSALVERAKTGDAAAFEDLMRLYERRVIAIGTGMGLTREDALDACQDSFIKVFKYIHRFRTGEVFFRWLYRIALNVIYDYLRAGRTKYISLEEAEEAGPAALRDPSRSPLEQVETETLTRRLRRELECLSRRERIVFVLRDLHQMPAERIGEILDISPVTIRRHCMSARQKLRARLMKAP